MNRRIQAGQFYDYERCKHRVYLDVHGDSNEKGGESAFLRLLWERGIQHEARVISRLSSQRQIAPIDASSEKEAFAQTLDWMVRGADLIYQGVLLTEGGIGRPDLLEKAAGPSKWGDYHYVPIDIKSGGGFENPQTRERVKKEYAHQVIFYLDLLEEIQGYRPLVGKVINIEGEEIVFPASAYEETYSASRKDIEEIVGGGKSYEPVLGGKCKLCPWLQHCSTWIKEHDDLSQIYWLGEGKYDFHARGIRTVEDMRRIHIANFMRPENRIPRVAEKTLAAYKRRARVLKEGKPLFHGPITFPSRSLEIFFDIEDDPTQGIVYLYGLWERPRGEIPRFRYFLAEKPQDQQAAFAALMEYLSRLDDFVIYHYGPHELTTLKKLGQTSGNHKPVLEKFHRSAVDIFRVIEKHTDWPLFSYGLKDIAKFLGFRWSVEDASGAANSIAWYAEYLKDPQKNRDFLERIVQYNREDCESLALVRDRLAGGIQ
ncbi:MAG: TM0106 family RecB-like putative nuclease [Candidatus Tectomicrobia bacterium]|uniref:TM0106 family RecB-like putative nuclease n=1 Tax=Tectimicrobiota bacterium TaxID=2528274 RepID=A0A932GRC8_UNCTE|nr:TM0106 family RecB-like putative nuclease [Candidatus Tectomicrobia bacterium]